MTLDFWLGTIAASGMMLIGWWAWDRAKAKAANRGLLMSTAADPSGMTLTKQGNLAKPSAGRRDQTAASSDDFSDRGRGSLIAAPRAGLLIAGAAALVFVLTYGLTLDAKPSSPNQVTIPGTSVTVACNGTTAIYSDGHAMSAVAGDPTCSSGKPVLPITGAPR